MSQVSPGWIRDHEGDLVSLEGAYYITVVEMEEQVDGAPKQFVVLLSFHTEGKDDVWLKVGSSAECFSYMNQLRSTLTEWQP